MHLGKLIGVVVPAYNEQRNIGRVIGAMPEFVDRIYIVDDCSQDATSEKVRLWQQAPLYSGRLQLVQHAVNQGAGASIVSGYQAAVADGVDVIAVMDGDGQMNPDELIRVITPVCEGRADCVKGNRFASGQAWQRMPRHRYFGNRCLALLTRIATGYWHLGDSQTGFVAVSNKAVQAMPMRELYSRYGYPNHLLIMLAVHEMRVIDVPIEPIYGIGEVSGIKLKKVVPRMSWLLLRKFLWRLKEQHQRRGLNLALGLYAAGALAGFAAIPLILLLLWQFVTTGSLAGTQSAALGITLAASSCAIAQALLCEIRHNYAQHAHCFIQPRTSKILPLPTVVLNAGIVPKQESKKVAA
jgi:glycosyltransferase involved in cell wall biosynthesis